MAIVGSHYDTVSYNDTVTVAELDDYWCRKGFRDSHEKITVNMVADIKAHREPEYEEGAVYRDAYGEIWQYGNSTWRIFGSPAVAKFETPKRPLRKLVPEADPEAPENSVERQTRQGINYIFETYSGSGEKLREY